MRLIQELRRRNVFRVTAGYVALSWLAIQVAETVFPAFGLADYVRVVVVVAVTGFIPTIAFAWVFELTPKGFKLDRDVDREAAEIRRLDKRLDRVAIIILALAVAYFAFDKLVLDPARDAAFRAALLGEPSARDPGSYGLRDAWLVTDFPGEHSRPAMAPDGGRMAFVSPDEQGVMQVWVMSLPDGQPLQITQGGKAATAPSWSPAGEEILFQRDMGDERGQSIWLVDSLGAGLARLVVPGGKSPSFAPDGRSFVFVRGRTEIWRGFLDDRDPEPLRGMPGSDGFAAPMPAINAVGDIVFVMAPEGPVGDLWLYSAASGEYRQLMRPTSGWPGSGTEWPVWMPDGRTVIYTAPDGDSTNVHLWRIDTATGESAKLTAGPGGYAHPSVAADGSRLAYAHSRPAWRLVATDPATGVDRVIHESRSAIALPIVSPDGRLITYFGEKGVFTIPVAGGQAEQRTFSAPAEATLPTWDRRDQSIVYYKGRTLQRLDRETGLSERVRANFHWSRQNWLAVYGDRLAYNLRGSRRTVVLDIGSGAERSLRRHVLPTDWSRDGLRLLARSPAGSEIVICTAPEFSCQPVLDGDAPAAGALPRWSTDESRVFYRQARQDRPGYAEILSVPVTGGESRVEAEIGPYDPRGMNFGIAAGDLIVWNEFGATGFSEIWVTDDLDRL